MVLQWTTILAFLSHLIDYFTPNAMRTAHKSAIICPDLSTFHTKRHKVYRRRSNAFFPLLLPESYSVPHPPPLLANKNRLNIYRRKKKKEMVQSDATFSFHIQKIEIILGKVRASITISFFPTMTSKAF